jgi:hypothetical protein
VVPEPWGVTSSVEPPASTVESAPTSASMTRRGRPRCAAPRPNTARCPRWCRPRYLPTPMADTARSSRGRPEPAGRLTPNHQIPQARGLVPDRVRSRAPRDCCEHLNHRRPRQLHGRIPSTRCTWPGPVPDHTLVSTGHQRDRLTQFGIPNDGPVIPAIEAHNLGQHVRIPSIRLRPRTRLALPGNESPTSDRSRTPHSQP